MDQSKKKKIAICVGTRPNFIKITQFQKHISQNSEFSFDLIHTGQHFDDNMSTIFFKQLKLKEPDKYLKATGNTQIEVIADISVKFEKYLLQAQPDLVIVPGDVNSSLACAMTASRNGIRLAHLESGLRSYDRSMPEEINRILIDHLSDIFFVTEEDGVTNLLNEGISDDNIHFVGNTMIDTLVAFDKNINDSNIISELSINSDFALLTFHRPSNVDDKEQLEKLAKILIELSNNIQLVFSVHPRTLKRLDEFDLLKSLRANEKITIINSLGYLDFMCLVKNSKFVLTDSGGIQEETSYLNVPCLTVRNNTERPSTIKLGSNKLLSLNAEEILAEANKIIQSNVKADNNIPLWDGRTTERIVKILNEII